MKKIIDLDEIETREKELEDELARLRTFKKFATKYGSDYAPTPGTIASALAEVATPAIGGTISAPAPPQADVEDALRYVISKIGNAPFTYPVLEQILTDIGSKFSRSSVFDAISALKEKGDIIVVLEGAGRRPATYKITDKFVPPQIN